MNDNSIDCIVTDPPYGLHFMGKDWDHGIPGQHFWTEAIRICKPGSMLLAFGGTRTFHRLTCAIEDAGWEIRDCLMWLYGSGFPKSHNHFGLPGYGTALKPAWEPIIMAMKPLDGTFAQNAEKWGVAGINIDECRIGSEQITTQLRDRSAWHGNQWGNGGYEKPIGESSPRTGRWPANLILDEEAAQMLDQQSGASRFFYCAKASSAERNAGLEGMPLKDADFKNASGRGIQRGDAYIEIKRQNNHPTVKPIALMQYLIKLVMPPNLDATLLDPFAGSGTTILAAKQLRYNAIGIEISPEYAEIAQKRLQTCKIPLEQFTIDEIYEKE